MKKIQLTQGKEALIDEEDFKRVSKNSWSYHHSGYVVRGKPQISLHRFIIGAKKGQYVDHINRNKLDNRKENLRLCSKKQNNSNSLFQDGVHWRGDREAWIVRMNVNGKKKYIGYFKKKKDAEEARRKASIKYHGEFSPYKKQESHGIHNISV